MVIGSMFTIVPPNIRDGLLPFQKENRICGIGYFQDFVTAFGKLHNNVFAIGYATTHGVLYIKLAGTVGGNGGAPGKNSAGNTVEGFAGGFVFNDAMGAAKTFAGSE
jgi:hypothetical protein